MLRRPRRSGFRLVSEGLRREAKTDSIRTTIISGSSGGRVQTDSPATLSRSTLTAPAGPACAQTDSTAPRREEGRRQRPSRAAAVRRLTSSGLISAVGANPCARSKWRSARLVAPSSAPSGLTAYPSFKSAIWAARTRCDSLTGLPRKRAPIWSGADDPEDRRGSCCAALPMEAVVSGGDARVARDWAAAGGGASEAALDAETGFGAACGATGSNFAAGGAEFAEAGSGATTAERTSGAGRRPICNRSALAPIPATNAARPAPTRTRLGAAMTRSLSRRTVPSPAGPSKDAELRIRTRASIKRLFHNNRSAKRAKTVSDPSRP